MRITAWALRFLHNSQRKHRGREKVRGALTTEEIANAKTCWMRKVQSNISPNLQAPGWELVKENTGILKCKGRIRGYNPTYIQGGVFAETLIAHTNGQIRDLGVANTMAAIRDNWWIPRLRSKLKKLINECNICKIFSTKPYGSTRTAEMPSFRIKIARPFETTGVDFAGPLTYKINKKKQGKSYALIFSCAASRAVHLELTKSQTVEEFQRKFNAFIARRTSSKLIISGNAAVFKTTASEKLQDYLAKQTSDGNSTLRNSLSGEGCTSG